MEVQQMGACDGMNEFVLLSHWTGRFGNRMHQYAYGATYSRLNDVDFFLCSDWEGTILFRNPAHRLLPDENLRIRINQIRGAHREQYRERVISDFMERTGLEVHYLSPETSPEPYRRQPFTYFSSLCAYNPAIFAPMSSDHLREIFQFSDEVKSLDIYKRLEDMQGSYDIAHLRRDDIANPQAVKSGYSVISIDAYRRAFRKYGFEESSILWVSDDYSNQWAEQLGFRVDATRLGWSYPLGSGYCPGIVFDWLADFLKLYFARTIFRANSSFSWWAGFLSPTARVFSPRLTERKLYGQHGLVEIEPDFEEGNHPHWVSLSSSPCPDIIIESAAC